MTDEKVTASTSIAHYLAVLHKAAREDAARGWNIGPVTPPESAAYGRRTVPPIRLDRAVPWQSDGRP